MIFRQNKSQLIPGAISPDSAFENFVSLCAALSIDQAVPMAAEQGVFL
jgi:hypothetical protein